MIPILGTLENMRCTRAFQDLHRRGRLGAQSMRPDSTAGVYAARIWLTSPSAHAARNARTTVGSNWARAKDTPWLVRLGEYDEKLAPLLFIPAAIVTLLAGVALVFDGPWSFTGEGWVFAGLVLFAAIFALGLGLIVPAGKRLAALARADAPAAELQKQVGKLRVLNWIDVGLLAAAIFFMTAKPVN
jgi:uncharacterized membrane protein